MAKKRGKRFHLLIYARMWQKWGLPSLLVALASGVLWLLAPRIQFLPSPLRTLILIPALASFAIFVYTFIARRMAWVQCRPGHLHIQTPIYPLAVSYARVKVVRPTEFSHIFDPSKEKPARRNWLRPYWGMTPWWWRSRAPSAMTRSSCRKSSPTSGSLGRRSASWSTSTDAFSRTASPGSSSDPDCSVRSRCPRWLGDVVCLAAASPR